MPWRGPCARFPAPFPSRDCRRWGLPALERLDVPALVVASHDVADPGHAYDVGAAWAERLPSARLVSEEPGESPLAWQGGRLSHAIADFCEEAAVRERLSG
jgi:hypothetical protein